MVDYKLSDEHGWVKRLRFGDQTTAEKLKIIGELINQTIQHGKRDRMVRKTTIKVLKAYDVKPKDHMGEIKAVHDWVKKNIRYTFDIYGVETFHMPRRTLLDRVGDCDDSAMLAAAMLGSIGYETGVILLDAQGDRKISHAMAAVKLPRPKNGQPRGWIPMETTKDMPLGWLPEKATRKIIVKARRS